MGDYVKVHGHRIHYEKVGDSGESALKIYKLLGDQP